MRPTTRCPRRRPALALTDVAIAIGVLAVLLAAISSALGAIENGRISTAERSIETLQAAAVNWLSNGRTSYDGISFQALRDENLLPAGFTEVASNPWGGNYLLEPAGDQITVGLTNVPQNGGASLTRKLGPRARSVSYDAGGRIFTATF
jgi:hypothetical protein